MPLSVTQGNGAEIRTKWKKSEPFFDNSGNEKGEARAGDILRQNQVSSPVRAITVPLRVDAFRH